MRYRYDADSICGVSVPIFTHYMNRLLHILQQSMKRLLQNMADINRVSKDIREPFLNAISKELQRKHI